MLETVPEVAGSTLLTGTGLGPRFRRASRAAESAARLTQGLRESPRNFRGVRLISVNRIGCIEDS
jgi:hypothetical protein